MGHDEAFKEFYLHSAREHLRELNEGVLQLEGKPYQPELLQKLLITSHSLKSEGAGMGFNQMVNLAHAIENTLVFVDQNKTGLNGKIANFLFNALDFATQSVNNIDTGTGQELDAGEAVTQLKKAVILQAASTTSQTAAVDEGQKPEEIEQVHSITLSVDKLDHLVKLSEELAILKVGLLSSPVISADEKLRQWAEQLDKVSADFQTYIMRISLFPISLAFYTLPRLVRDTAQKTGKTVRLDIAGSKVTVDRFIIHHLTEIVVHLIRNAIDHGIETPEERRQKGKPEEAVVSIKAFIRDKHLYVTIGDDGAGIDWDKLAQAAVNKGYYTTEELSGWTEKEKESKLLFTNQLSTSDSVTEISGRGVGLGAVSRAVQKLDGTLSVSTTKGVGTMFTVCLPVAVDVMEVLVVSIGGRPYAIPTDYVVRVATADLDQIFLTKEGPYLEIGGDKATLVDLMTLLKIDGEDGERKSSSTLNVVVIRYDGKLMALLVDMVESKEEVVVKPLESSLIQGPYLSGLTVLDNGKVVPIVKISKVMAE